MHAHAHWLEGMGGLLRAGGRLVVHEDPGYRAIPDTQWRKRGEMRALWWEHRVEVCVWIEREFPTLVESSLNEPPDRSTVRYYEDLHNAIVRRLVAK